MKKKRKMQQNQVFIVLVVIVVLVVVFLVFILSRKPVVGKAINVLSDLELYYSFDTPGGNFLDLSGKSHDGTAQGVSLISNDGIGVPKSSVSFSGLPTSFLSVPLTSPNLLTLSFWVKFDAVNKDTSESILRWSESNTPLSGAVPFLKIVREGNNLKYFVDGAFQNVATNSNYLPNKLSRSQINVPSQVSDGKWHSVTVTQELSSELKSDASTSRSYKQKYGFYLDGELVGTYYNTAAASSGSGQYLIVGASGQEPSFSGRLDEVQVYSRVLTAEEIKNSFTENAPNNLVPVILHYEFSGGSLQDSSTNGAYPGTLSSDVGRRPVVGEGIDDQGGYLFAGNNYIDAGDIASLAGQTSYTISGWFKLKTSGTHWLFYSDAGATQIIGLETYAGDLRVYGGKSSSVTVLDVYPYGSGQYLVDLNEWVYLALVFDGQVEDKWQRMKVYVNGQQVEFQSTSNFALISSPVPDTSNFYLGSKTLSTATQTNGWNGNIDDFRIYYYALTPMEVAKLYDQFIPTCNDGQKNQGEEGVDCGGPCAAVCDFDQDDDGICDGSESLVNVCVRGASGRDNCLNVPNGPEQGRCVLTGSSCADNVFCSGSKNSCSLDQEDLDYDGQGDVCDLDQDGDGLENNVDPDPRDVDADNDGKCDGSIALTIPNSCEAGPDNCPLLANPDQADLDLDKFGNVCDADRDGDGVCGDRNLEVAPNCNGLDVDDLDAHKSCNSDADCTLPRRCILVQSVGQHCTLPTGLLADVVNEQSELVPDGCVTLEDVAYLADKINLNFVFDCVSPNQNLLVSDGDAVGVENQEKDGCVTLEDVAVFVESILENYVEACNLN